jgi:alanyl-tRNA synthetase
LVPVVVTATVGVYDELAAAQARVTTWLEQEEKQFAETLDRSSGPLMAAIERAKAAGSSALPGEDVFRLHDTYGLPRELAADFAAEEGLSLDDEGFERAMAEQRKRARARAEEDFASTARAGYRDLANRTSFVGHEACEAEGCVIGMIRNGTSVDSLTAGSEGEVFLDRTPFYAEIGGQVGDTGVMVSAGARAEVLDTSFPVEGAHAHHVRVIEGDLKVGQTVTGRVDEQRRQAIARAHTATHLLHHVLRDVLGEHAVQSGSLVEPDRLRFDFAHFAALTDEEKCRIEEGVVDLALRNEDLSAPVMDLEEARSMGAIALFGEKYGERVRVVKIGDYSRELCGGTHLPSSAAIGGFAIVSEGSIGAGLRRIEAVTGKEAQDLALAQRDLLGHAADLMKCPPDGVAERIRALQSELRSAQREIERLQQKSAGALVDDLANQAVDVDGVRVVAARVEAVRSGALRNLADQIRDGLGSGIVVLGCAHEGRVQFVSAVSADLTDAGFHAGRLVGEVAKVAGGGGGGRPDFAQAGGKNPERLDEALDRVRDLVAAQKA